MSKPSLRVQSSPLSVVLNFYLSAEVANKAVESLPLRCPHVSRRDHPQRDSSLAQSRQSVLQEPEAVPLDESHDHVDLVGARELRTYLVPHAGLTLSVRE